VATFPHGDGTKAVRIEGDEVVALAQPDVHALVGLSSGCKTSLRTRMAPACICVGHNWVARIRLELLRYPTLFAKLCSAGSNGSPGLPAASDQVRVTQVRASANPSIVPRHPRGAQPCLGEINLAGYHKRTRSRLHAT
jgi:hypothetical protein